MLQVIVTLANDSIRAGIPIGGQGDDTGHATPDPPEEPSAGGLTPEPDASIPVGLTYGGADT